MLHTHNLYVLPVGPLLYVPVYPVLDPEGEAGVVPGVQGGLLLLDGQPPPPRQQVLQFLQGAP